MLAVGQCAGWDGLNAKHFYQMKIVENYDDHDEKNCDIVDENYDENIDIDEKNIVILLMKTMIKILILMKRIL